MSNLIQYSQLAVQNLHTCDKQIILAIHQSEKIKDLPDEEIVKLSSFIISHTLLMLGHKNVFASDEDRTFTEVIFAKQIKSHLPNFTKAELLLALDKALLGVPEKGVKPTIEYFSIANFFKAIDEYQLEKNKAILNYWNERNKQIEKELEQKRKERNKKYLQDVFLISFKQNLPRGEGFEPAFSTITEIILENNLYKVSTEKKWEMVLEEREKIANSITDFERLWRPEQVEFFLKNYTQKKIFENNYFFWRAVENTKIRLFFEIIEYFKILPAEETDVIKQKIIDLIKEKQNL